MNPSFHHSTPRTKLRRRVVRQLLPTVVGVVAIVGATSGPASAAGGDDFYWAKALSGSHAAAVNFTGNTSFNFTLTVTDGAGDPYCTAVEYQLITDTSASPVVRLPALCRGNSTNFSNGWAPGGGQRVEALRFRAVYGQTTGKWVTCFNGDDDHDNDGNRDFCS